jgi:hypothetical protein
MKLKYGDRVCRGDNGMLKRYFGLIGTVIRPAVTQGWAALRAGERLVAWDDGHVRVEERKNLQRTTP